MCPRATVEHGGAAMASAHSFGELEEYIDLDLSSCGGEYELRVCRSKPEEMLCRGRLHKVAPDAEATAGCGRRSTATVAPLQQHSHVRSAQPARMHAEGSGRRRKAAVHATLQASRAFFRSLFARTSCSDERCHGGIGAPSGSRAPTLVSHQTKKSISAGGPTTLRSSIEQEKLMDEEQEQAASIRQRKSFSSVIRWRPLTATAAPAPAPPTPPPVSSSTRRNSCGSVPAAAAALKRSSSCRSESEGLIQGAIAYCKRSQQQRVLLARKSVSDAAL